MTLLNTQVQHRSAFLIAKEFKSGTKYFGWAENRSTKHWGESPRWLVDPHKAAPHGTAESAANKIQNGVLKVSFKNAFVARLDTKEIHHVTTRLDVSVFESGELPQEVL